MQTERITPALAIQNSYTALKAGDRRTARRWAQQAAALAPQREEPWLLLAALASPETSLAYLRRALAIAPGSQRAIQGMAWAEKRLAAAPLSAHPLRPPRDSQPVPVHPPLPIQQLPPPTTQEHAARTPRCRSVPLWFIVGILLACGLAATLLVIQVFGLDVPSAPSIVALLSAPQPLQNSSQVETGVPFPTATPSVTPTATFTITFTPPSTATPLPTNTPPPTATPIPPAVPTQKPADPPQPVAATRSLTYVVKRGDTLSSIAAAYKVNLQTLISVNHITNPSSIHAGLKLTIPGASSGGSAPPAVQPVVYQPPSGQKSVLVSISKQHLYAYENGNEVFNFTASTGRNNTTLTGDFKILDKIPNAWSDPWGFWMPDWLGIYYVGYNLENGIHSLPVLTNGTQIWGDALGTPISYGCVVLAPADAKRLFDWVDIGTPIQIRR